MIDFDCFPIIYSQILIRGVTDFSFTILLLPVHTAVDSLLTTTPMMDVDTLVKQRTLFFAFWFNGPWCCCVLAVGAVLAPKNNNHGGDPAR